VRTVHRSEPVGTATRALAGRPSATNSLHAQTRGNDSPMRASAVFHATAAILLARCQ
jgi:hypothetical protein